MMGFIKKVFGKVERKHTNHVDLPESLLRSVEFSVDDDERELKKSKFVEVREDPDEQWNPEENPRS